MALRHNVIANAAGQGLSVVLSLAFLPVYIRQLGLEAYGLVGLFAMVNAFLVLLDLGLGATLNREVARFVGGARSTESLADLKRTVFVLTTGLALAFGAIASLLAPWVAQHWVNAGQLPADTVTLALVLMGWVVSLRLIESLYRGIAMGLQRHVALNVLAGFVNLFRWAGAAAALIWIDASIETFFFWQGLSSVLGLITLRYFVNVRLPKPSRSPRFSLGELAAVWKFAGGLVVTMVLSLILTHGDKILLSGILSLNEFGLYAFATTAAASVCHLVQPITSSVYPRLAELQAKSDHDRTVRTYHTACQVSAVLLFPAAFLVIMFGERLLFIWTGDLELARAASPLLAVLAAGFTLNAIMQVPYVLQLASGWPGLAAKVNAVAVVVMVPALLLIAPVYGGIGAAWIWFAINAGYVLAMVPWMHTRLLPTEKWRWYLVDVGAPLAVVTALGILLWRYGPEPASRLLDLAWLTGCGAILMAAAFVATPLRAHFRRFIPILRSVR